MVKRKFGLELESFGLAGKDLFKIIREVVPEGKFIDNLHTHRGPTYFDGKTWQGMADGSIGNTGYLPDGTPVRPKSASLGYATWDRPGTHELVSPVLPGGRGMKDALAVIRGLKKAGADVDISTGLHVTFGLDNARWQRMGKKKRAKTLQRLVDSYNWFGPGINSILAPSRRGGQWAAFNTLKESLSDKYSAVNLSKFNSAGVVEFRQHQGTLDALKVKNWVNLLDKLLNFSTNEEFKNIDFKDYDRDLEGLLSALKLPEKQKEYWRGRRDTFAQGRFGGQNRFGVRAASTIGYEQDDLTNSLYSPDWGRIREFQRRGIG